MKESMQCLYIKNDERLYDSSTDDHHMMKIMISKYHDFLLIPIVKEIESEEKYGNIY
jgi:hypothetical protein